MKLPNGKRLDVFVLILLLSVSSFYAYVTKDLFAGKALFVAIMFLVPPIIYMGLRGGHKNWEKILVSTLVFGGLFGFSLDFIAEYTRTWTVTSLIFPIRILGVNSLENLIGIMLMTALTVVFYEHFVDREKNHHVSKHLIYAVLPAIFVIAYLLFVFFYQPTLLHAKYPYLIMGIFAITPTITLSFIKPNLIKKMAITAIYFFFLYFIIELFAVSYGWWVFKGNNYIGWITFFGIAFPFEELFFWMLFYAASIVSYYELFIDDEA